MSVAIYVCDLHTYIQIGYACKYIYLKINIQDQDYTSTLPEAGPQHAVGKAPRSFADRHDLKQAMAVEQVGYPQNAESLIILCRPMSLSSSSWSARPFICVCFAVCASSNPIHATKIGALRKRSKVAMAHHEQHRLSKQIPDLICCAPRRKSTFWRNFAA